MGGRGRGPAGWFATLSAVDRARFVRLRRQGKSFLDLAGEFGVSEKTVQRACHRSGLRGRQSAQGVRLLAYIGARFAAGYQAEAEGTKLRSQATSRRQVSVLRKALEEVLLRGFEAHVAGLPADEGAELEPEPGTYAYAYAARWAEAAVEALFSGQWPEGSEILRSEVDRLQRGAPDDFALKVQIDQIRKSGAKSSRPLR